MSDVKIPEDVRQLAVEIHLSERKAKGRTLGLTDYTIAIAKGILAERERCAKIAENWNYPPENTAHGIAHAVRSSHE